MKTLLPLFVGFVMMGCAASDSDGAGAATSDIVHGDLALASDLPDYCSGPEVVRIDRPVSSGDEATGVAANSRTFSYGFRYRAPTAPGAPVVVMLPGGPGQGFMEDAPAFVPEGWGYLLTDPRGVGCNALANVPPPDVAASFFTTQEIADDVIAAIEQQHLEDYVLFGVSYGTLLGTTVAHRLEAAHGPAPKAVVLEGVLGKAFGHTDQDFAGENYVAQFERIRGVLPADVLTELDTSPTPFGLTSVEITRAMQALMPASLNLAATQLVSLSHQLEGITDEVRAQALATLKKLGDEAQLTKPGEVALYRYVACREIMDTVPASDLDVVFSHGHLVRNTAEEGTKCSGLHTTTPYDAAKLQFSSKVYYFLGENDVATPPWQGEYHYATHTAGPAVKVVTSKGGHNSLRYNQQGCAQKVMASIAGGGADLDAVLATCPLPVTVEKK